MRIGHQAGAEQASADFGYCSLLNKGQILSAFLIGIVEIIFVLSAPRNVVRGLQSVDVYHTLIC